MKNGPTMLLPLAALLSIWGGASSAPVLKCSPSATTVSIQDANGNVIDTINCTSGSILMPNGTSITQGVSTVPGSAAGDITVESTGAGNKIVLKEGTLNGLVQIRAGTAGGGNFSVVRDSDGTAMLNCPATTPDCEFVSGFRVRGGTVQAGFTETLCTNATVSARTADLAKFTAPWSATVNQCSFVVDVVGATGGTCNYTLRDTTASADVGTAAISCTAAEGTQGAFASGTLTATHIYDLRVIAPASDTAAKGCMVCHFIY